MRNILITGGTGKIAQQLVAGLLAESHQVIFTSTKPGKINDLLHQFKNPLLSGYELNFFQEKDLVEWVRKLAIKVDAVIHNARTLETLSNNDQGEATKDYFVKEIEMATVYPYLLNQALLANHHPLRDIIFISSMYGSVAPNPKLYDDFKKQSPIQYGVAKSAQIHLTKELAVRLADDKIRVNCISYGGVQGRVSEDFLKRYQALTPMQRMLDSSDLYPPIQFILNNPTLAITGENIKIDGGWTTW
jgi:NAD(P)-dependent dehydrogenase (short-subunit alcohol dehydrogenase family)